MFCDCRNIFNQKSYLSNYPKNYICKKRTVLDGKRRSNGHCRRGRSVKLDWPRSDETGLNAAMVECDMVGGAAI